MSRGGEVKVEIVALLTEYTVYESYINTKGCLNTILLIIISISRRKLCKG
jgi:hypothetical protein